MSSTSNSKNNDLSSSCNKKHNESLEKQINKLQIELTKKDKEISSLQSELQIFKKSTNNTSSQFPLPSEFKKQWLNLIQTSIMDSFDTIYSNSILLSISVQRSVQSIYDQTLKLIHSKIVFLLNCLGIIDQNEEVIQMFFLKFRKILLQDYYKTIFCCNEAFIKSTIEVIKESIFNNERRFHFCFTHKDKEDILKDLNSNAMSKFIEEAFGLSLYMGLHDPPLSLNINDKIEYFYYSKSEYINIEGFAKDNSPCLMILYPPIIKVNSIFNGIKAAVYACETVTEDIIAQCDANRQYQKTKKQPSKALSDGEGKFSVNTSNEAGLDSESPIKYNLGEVNNHSPYQKDLSLKSKLNVKEHYASSSGTNINTFNGNIEHTRHKTSNENTSGDIRDKQSNGNNKVTMFEVNEANTSKLTMNITMNKNAKGNLNNNNNQRSKSQSKAYPNVVTKHLQKLLPSNNGKPKKEEITKPQVTSNILTFNRTKIKENILNNAKNLISNNEKREKGDKSNSNISSTAVKSKERTKEINRSNANQSSNKSNSPNHIIDKSRNNGSIDTSSNNTTNKSKYDINKTSDYPLTTEIKRSSNSPSHNYLKTPIPKKKEYYTNNNRESSNRKDNPNPNGLSNALLYSNVDDIISYSHNATTNDKKYRQENTGNLNTSNSIIDSKGNYLQISIKKQNNEHLYLRKIISDTNENYQLYSTSNQPNEMNNDKSSNSFRRSDSNPKGNHQRKANISNSNSNSHLLRTNSQPEDANTYYGNTLNRNDSSSNSLLMNTSNHSQTSINNVRSSKQVNKTNHLFPPNSNNNSRTSILNSNITNNTANNKLEYNSSLKQSNSKNSPTIIFNAGKIMNQPSTTTNPVIKTDYNMTSLNNNTIPTIKGPNSNRSINSLNQRGMMVTNDFKFNGIRKNDYPLQKKNSLGSNNKRKQDVQLNYDISSYQFQTMNINSPSFRTEKDKSLGLTSQFSINKGNGNSNALASTFGNNTTCTDHQNMPTKYSSNDGGGYENYYLSNSKQRKYGGGCQINTQLGHLEVKIEASFGNKK